MDKPPYLKELVQTNIPVVVRITKRVGQYPETDFKTKAETGRMQTLYNFTLPNGQVARHYAKEREEETLSMFSSGEEVQVVWQEGKNEETHQTFRFPVWTPKEGAEARLAANPPAQSNTQQTASKREFDERERLKEEMDKKKQEGYAKSQIGNNLGMSTKLFMDSLKELRPFDPTSDKTVEEYLTKIFTGALELAQHVRPRFNLAVSECYAEDTGEKIVANPETKPLFSKEELAALPF